jgi:hypothetical protein
MGQVRYDYIFNLPSSSTEKEGFPETEDLDLED